LALAKSSAAIRFLTSHGLRSIRGFAVDTKLYPVVNGCYLDKNSEMFKVRMLGYIGDQLNHIVIEDTSGSIKSVDIQDWIGMHLTPCCISSSTIHSESKYPA